MRVLGIALVVTLVDQLSKLAIQQHMALYQSIPVIPGFFHITYIINRGAAFGLLEDQQWLFLAMALILFGLYFVFRKKMPAVPQVYLGTGLLLGGALGNALDRTISGQVTDFFDFRIWPVFNVADMGIVLGVLLLLWYNWTHISDK